VDNNAEKQKITHLLPVRNGEKFLAQVLRSISVNAACGDQILILDDGSSDNSLFLMQEFARNNQNVELISTGGIGLVASLNLGIANSTSDWVARYDVDDNYEDDRIGRQLDAIDTGTVAIFSDYDFWIDGRKYAGFIPSPIFAGATKLSLVKSQQTPHPSALLSRSAVLDVGSYLQHEYPAEDLGLWLRLSRVGSLISVPETLLHYRLSKSSITGTLREQSRNTTQNLIAKFRKDFLVYSSVEHIEEDWSNYSQHSHSLERKIFMFRNLLIAESKFGVFLPKKLKGKLMLDLSKQTPINEFYTMAKYKLIRQVHRIS
jgi:glycosyltransferase involved in cell wall biosynthesis